MTNPFYRTHYIGISGALLIILGLLFHYWGNDAWQQWKADQKITSLQSTIKEREQSLNHTFDSLKNMGFNEVVGHFDELSSKAHQSGYFLYIFKDRNLMLWSHNHILPEIKAPPDNTLRLKKLDNGYYLQKSISNQKLTFSALIPVKTAYAIQNRYLQNRLLHVENPEEHISFHVKNTKGQPIQSQSGENLFFLAVKDQLPQSNLPFWFLGIGSILLLISLQTTLARALQNHHFPKTVISFCGILGLLLLWLFFEKPSFFFNHQIFKAKNFAASDLLDSLGDVLVLMVFVTVFVHLLNAFFGGFLTKSTIKHYLGHFFLFGSAIAVAHGFGWLINSLVIHSNIYLDIQDFFEISSLSIVALGIIFLGFFNLIRFIYWAFHRLYPKNKKPDKHDVIPLFFLGLIYWALVFIEILPFYGGFALALGLWIGFYWLQNERLSEFKPLIYFSIIGCFFMASHFLHANEQREISQRKLLASKIATQRNTLSEYLFNNVSKNLKQDKFVRDFFQNPMISKSLIDQRIRQLYLNRFLNQYDLSIYTYKYGGVPYKSRAKKQLEHFKKLIENARKASVGNNFYFLRNKVSRPTYLAHYEFKNLGKIFGTLIIELKKKVFYEESIYPELLLQKDLKENDGLKNYSYAIYKNNRLISQKGDYPYPVISRPEENKSFVLFHENNYSHLYHKEDSKTFVLLSKKAKGLLYPVSIFSFLFLIQFFLALLIKGVWDTRLYKFKNWKVWYEAIRKGKIRPFKDLLFQRKIQFAISLAVLLVLVSVGFSTVNYFKRNYNERLNENLENKTRLILSQIEQTMQSNESNLFFQNREKLFKTVKSLSNQYQTDINVYDLDGNLVTTSQSGIYDKNIIQSLIDARAFYQLRVNNSSQLIQNETIGNLKYLASYTPIRNNNNQILGFLHLPYFAKETKLKNEISSLVITLVNLYVMVFIVIVVISLLISNALMKPLNLIRDQLKKTQLGKSNEPIDWKSKDEIGHLIREYNTKIHELKENAEALAQSEREGAWREMARQVAHEIKNPLTPMKLNIQKLQRSFNQNQTADPNEIKRVSNVLIRQIDHLSKIATEFSDFSKIPAGKNEQVNLEEKIKNTVSLFDGQSGPVLQTDLNTHNTNLIIDDDHLSRVLNNLIKNAYQAFPSGETGKIEIGTALQNGTSDRVLCWVKDNGNGIPNEKADKIFKPNFSTKNSGMGLGLAIVRKIVEESQGKIWFVSRENEGTTFYIEWPISQL